MPDVTVHGARLRYEEHGSGAPVVFLHGALATRHAFRGQRAALHDLGRLILVDQRGHGESAHFGVEVPWDTLRYDRLVADAHAFLDAVAPDEPAHLVGVSMGGMVSARVAAERPSRVASLALLSTTATNDGPWRAFFARAQPEDMRFARLAARWHGEPYWRDLARAMFRYLADERRAFPERLDVPRGLVVQAEDDELLARGDAEAWAARFAGPVEVVRAPGDHQFFADGRAGSQAANRALRAHLELVLRS